MVMRAPARLETLSALLRDRRLEQVRTAARECSELRAELQQLADAAHRSHEAASELRSAVVIARHEQWRAARRRELNTSLAAAIARWDRCRSAAAQALGRHETLCQLRRREEARAAHRTETRAQCTD